MQGAMHSARAQPDAPAAAPQKAVTSAARGVMHFAQGRARGLGSAVRPCLIVGAGRVGHLTAKRLLDRPELGLRPVGFLDKEPLEVEDSSGLEVLGASWDFDEIVVQY